MQFDYTNPKSGNIYEVSVALLKTGQIDVSAALLTRKHGGRDETRRGHKEIECAVGQDHAKAAREALQASQETAAQFFAKGKLYTTLGTRTSAPRLLSDFLP